MQHPGKQEQDRDEEAFSCLHLFENAKHTGSELCKVNILQWIISFLG